MGKHGPGIWMRPPGSQNERMTSEMSSVSPAPQITCSGA